MGLKAASPRKTQYTVRQVPAAVDRLLRAKARQEHKSLNQLALEALSREAGQGPGAVVHTDLDDVIGTWVEDPAFDEAVAAQHKIDRGLWK